MYFDTNTAKKEFINEAYRQIAEYINADDLFTWDKDCKRIDLITSTPFLIINNNYPVSYMENDSIEIHHNIRPYQIVPVLFNLVGDNYSLDIQISEDYNYKIPKEFIMKDTIDKKLDFLNLKESTILLLHSSLPNRGIRYTPPVVHLKNKDNITAFHSIESPHHTILLNELDDFKNKKEENWIDRLFKHFHTSEFYILNKYGFPLWFRLNLGTKIEYDPIRFHIESTPSGKVIQTAYYGYNMILDNLINTNFQSIKDEIQIRLVNPNNTNKFTKKFKNERTETNYIRNTTNDQWSKIDTFAISNDKLQFLLLNFLNYIKENKLKITYVKYNPKEIQIDKYLDDNILFYPIFKDNKISIIDMGELDDNKRNKYYLPIHSIHISYLYKYISNKEIGDIIIYRISSKCPNILDKDIVDYALAKDVVDNNGDSLYEINI